MESITENVHKLNDMIIQGKALEAFDLFYAEDIVMQENDQKPTSGKQANREREEEFFGKVTEFRNAEVLNVAVGVGCTMVEWHLDYTHEDWGVRNYRQVSVQEWHDGKVVKETFYILLRKLRRPVMSNNIVQTDDLWSLLVLRITLAVVLFPHGAQKMLGWFGGYGFNGTMEFFTETVGLPWLVGFLVILIEFIGPLLLVAGIYTRLVATSIFGLFVGIIFTSHLQHGFFLNWYGDQAGEGFEYHLLVLGMAIALIISGAGRRPVPA